MIDIDTDIDNLAYRLWSTSIHAFTSYLADRRTDKHTQVITTPVSP